MQIKTAAHGVALHDLTGGNAAQTGLQGTLDAFQALVVQTHKAQQLPGHMLEGIDPVVFLGQADAREISLAHGLGGIVVHLALEPDETALGLGKFVIELLGLHAQNGPQRIRHDQEVLDFLRLGIHRAGFDAAGQHLAVAVVDHAPAAGDQFGSHVLAAGPVGQTRPFDHLQIPGPSPEAKPEQTENADHRVDPQTPPVHLFHPDGTGARAFPGTGVAVDARRLVAPGRKTGSVAFA